MSRLKRRITNSNNYYGKIVASQLQTGTEHCKHCYLSPEIVKKVIRTYPDKLLDGEEILPFYQIIISQILKR